MTYLKDLKLLYNNLVYFESDSEKIKEHYKKLLSISIYYVNVPYMFCDHLNINNKWLIYFIDKEINIIELHSINDKRYNHLIVNYWIENNNIEYGTISRTVIKLGDETILETDEDKEFFKCVNAKSYCYLDSYFNSINIQFILLNPIKQSNNISFNKLKDIDLNLKLYPFILLRD